MKQYLQNSLRALFLSLTVLLSLPMLAVHVEIDGINYELVAKIKQATVISKSSGTYSGEVIIPESVEHEGTAYSVTSIGGGAFYACSGLTSVTIPNSVTIIEAWAFHGCSGLTSVHISDLSAWFNIDFADSYSNPLFSAHHLYLNGEEVKDLVIPNSVTSIGDIAFHNCRSLTSVTIPNSVTSIGDCAFYDCFRLTSVTIPNSVTSIGGSAFSDCSGLTSVTIGNSVTSIGSYAFYECSGLTSVHISDIAAWCNIDFDYYSNPLRYAHHLYLNGEEVKDLVIPNSVTSIGSYAFEGCSGLTSVTIPNSVTSIGGSAFERCKGLTSVHISDIAAWCNIDFSSNPLTYAHHLYLNGEEVKDLVIPNSVTSIGEYAFEGCSGLTSVTIPNSVTSIGDCAFWDCSGLTSVTIPNSVTSIGDRAFCGCSGLTSVTIPNSVTSIEYYAFYGCSGLTSVTIPNSVTSIGMNAFRDCSELLDVYCYAEKVPATESDAFDGSYPEYATLHVPDASIDSYKATAPWSSFGKIVALTDEETGIEELKAGNGTKASVLFDLNGRRVQKAQKGLYIQNGRKVLVK